VFHLVSCIPQNGMVVLAGDMNVHAVLAVIGCMVVWGIETGMQMVPGS